MRVAIDIRRTGDFGVGTYIRNILHQLARQDGAIRYLLVGERRHFAELAPLAENFQLLEFAAEPDTLKNHVGLPLALRREDVDLLHVPWFHAPALLRCKLVMTVHDLTERMAPEATGGRGESAISRSLRYRLANRALRRASRIITVSYATKKELARQFAIPEAKLQVIYNALDERLVSEPFPADAERVLERHAVNYPFVLYAGSIRPQKNLVRLIEAFAVAKSELRVRDDLAMLKLVVIGDELTKHPDLRRAVIRSRVREDVRFLGFVPYPVLRVFYARAKAFLFPSLSEGFGLPPLEAMAHGTPVVASNVSSLPEVLGTAALQVNPENVFDISRGIRQVLTDDALRHDLIQRGYEQLQQYSWERSAAQVRRVYEAVAGVNQAAGG
jgi:glycosyltransferase involved in cell wall biosynthesis